MTLSIRRIILTILFILALIGLSIIGVAWFSRINNPYTPSFTPSETMVWWGIIRSYSEHDIVWSLGLISFYTLLAVVGEIGLRHRFGLNPSSEMFFLRLFLLVLPLQAVRLFVLFHKDFGIMATRIAWFGRFLGINALLNISFYSTNMLLRRSGYILGMGALASLAIAVMMPFDVTQPMGNLLYRSGIDTALALSCVALEVLAVLSLVGLGVSHMNNRYYWLALSLLFVITGNDLSFFGDISLVIPGALLMIIGVAGFSWFMRNNYQWL